MADKDTINKSKTGLVVFDLLESARQNIVNRGIFEPAVNMVSNCRSLGIPVFFTRPLHRPDGADLARTQTDMDRDHRRYGPDYPRRTTPSAGGAGSPLTLPLAEFNMGPGDYDITKHRWSAFFGTALDLSLRTRGIDTILIMGGTTHIGVASTVYAARDLDYQIYVISDACHGTAKELSSLLEDIFPQVGHVRTSEEILSMIS